MRKTLHRGKGGSGVHCSSTPWNYTSGMPTLLTCLILLLATVRVTRLIVFDRLSEPLRQWLVDKWGPESMFVYLWFCPWCMGFWVSLAASTVAWVATDLPSYLTVPWWAGVPLAALAVSYLVGFILSKEN